MSEILITKIEIFDLLGNAILTTDIQNNIDVTNFQSGMYVIKIHSDNGQVTKKVVLD